MRQFFKGGVLHGSKILLALGLISAFMQCVYAVNLNSAIGYWQTIDERSGRVTSIVQIWQNPKDHNYYGKIYKIFPVQGYKVTDVCSQCRGNLKNKPMLGLQIIRNMVYRGDKYVEGYILDPRIGKEYHAQMRLAAGGQILKLRGYIGLPLFGKTAEWRRAPKIN